MSSITDATASAIDPNESEAGGCYCESECYCDTDEDLIDMESEDTTLFAHLFDNKMLKVYCEAGEDGVLQIDFHRTVRVPDNMGTSELPPSLGTFPLYSVAEFKDALPEKMAAKGGIFFPMYQREAMWMNFSADRPFAVKVYVGGINAISGEPKIETEATIVRRQKLMIQNKSVQDYLVCGPHKKHQDWIDGIVKTDGSVGQFVAMPLGSGHTVEAQISGQEAVAGIQIEIMPVKYEKGMIISIRTLSGRSIDLDVTGDVTIAEAKATVYELEGVTVKEQRLLYKGKQLEDRYTFDDYNIKNHSVISLILRLQGGGNTDQAAPPKGQPAPACPVPEMGIAAGGNIRQVIRKDFHPADIWDQERVILFNVQILNSAVFSKVTNLPPPETPITAAAYAEQGLPFYSVYDEPSGIVGQFQGVQTVAEKMEEDGEDMEADEDEEDLTILTIALDDNLNPSRFLPVAQMEAELEKREAAEFQRKFVLLSRHDSVEMPE